MQKTTSSRLYAIVDASNPDAIKALKAAVAAFEPRCREGKTLTVGGTQNVLFIELRKREGPVFDILKHMAGRFTFYPFYVVEEGENLPPKSDKYGNGCAYSVVKAVMFDFAVPEDGFGAWQERFREVAKKIYKADSVFLKAHTYKRETDNTIHVIIGNTESTDRQARPEDVKLGEAGWAEAVQKLAEKLQLNPEFKEIRYKSL